MLKWLGREISRLYLRPVVNGRICEYAISMRSEKDQPMVYVDQGNGVSFVLSPREFSKQLGT